MNLKELFDLKGKNALITGGSQGIGKSMALGLAEFGANIIIHYNSNHEKAARTLEELNEHDVETGSIAMDLAQKDSASSIFEYCHSTLGAVDILVLNASHQSINNWEQIGFDECHNHFNINVLSSLFLIQQFVPMMRKKNWGRIITLGSVQQRNPNPLHMIYASTKSALMNIVTNLAPELAKHNITINNIAPGAFDTVRNENALPDEKYYQKIINKRSRKLCV